MNFASPFVYRGKEEKEEEVVVDAEELHDGLSRIAETMEVEEDEDTSVPSVSDDAPRSAGFPDPTPPSFSFGFGSNPSSFSFGGASTASAGLPPRPIPPPPSNSGGFGLFSFPRTSTPGVSSAPIAPPEVQRKGMKKKYERNHVRTPGEAPVYKRKVDSNILQLELGTLGDDVTLSTGDAIFCTGCSVAFSTLSTLTGASNNEWECEFCGVKNTVDMFEGEKPSSDTLDYLVLPPPKLETHKSESEGSIVLFVVDVSGSMCVTSEVRGIQANGRPTPALGAIEGITEDELREAQRFQRGRNVTYISRLEAIQGSIQRQVDAILKDHPTYRVGLITFAGDVTLFGDGSSEPRVISGDRLHSYEDLIDIGSKYPLEKSISETIDSFKRKLASLETKGPTALGPAITCSVAMASKKAGSKIVIATDGIANIGLGSLENSKTNESERLAATAFYAQIGNWAKDHGIVIDVIGIEGDCDLENLGIMSEATGGEVNKVKPSDILSNASNLVSSDIVATGVTATLFLHKGLQFRALEGAPVVPGEGSGEVGALNKVLRDIGNVTRQTEVTFEYEVKDASSAPEKGTLPFQVQISFSRLDGSKCLRVISKSQSLTTDKEVAMKHADMSLLAGHAQQRCAALASAGDYLEARSEMLVWGKVMAEGASTEEQKFARNAFISKNVTFESQLKGAMDTEGGGLGGSTMSPSIELSERERNIRRDARTRDRSSNDELSSAIRQQKKGGSHHYSPYTRGPSK